MQCRSCSATNDTDAAFCTQCGNTLSSRETIPPSGKKRLLAMVLLSVVALVIMAAVGYYKFVLPTGIAATVNGEEITRGELDAAVKAVAAAADRSQAEDPAALQRLRYQVLNRMIAERIVLQEARKGGVALSRGEAAERVRMADNAWMWERMRGASIRISLDEQWSAAGCGCCGSRAGTSDAKAQKNCGMAAPTTM